MTGTHPEKRLIGYARISIVGQTLDRQLVQLRAACRPNVQMSVPSSAMGRAVCERTPRGNVRQSQHDESFFEIAKLISLSI